MSLKKTVAIAAAVGALAAISVPAMALENEFHGFYTIKGFVSNFNDGGAADLSPAALRKNERANNYAEQRARIFYTGKASDDLKLVTAFEMDTRFGGVTNGKYTNTSDGGVLDGDGRLIPSLNRKEIQRLRDAGVITGGMIPKVEACLNALDAGCQRALILDGRSPSSLRRYLLDDAPLGTVVTN